MRNNQVNVSALTKREIETVVAAANFTKSQEVIFNAMNNDYIYDIAVMQNLGIPANKYYKIKKITADKVERIVVEYGYYHAINGDKKRIQS
jgi:hypothetical protein